MAATDQAGDDGWEPAHLVAPAKAVRLRGALKAGVRDELVRLGVAPLDKAASADQLKVAQAQLLGWLDGVLLAEASVGTQAHM